MYEVVPVAGNKFEAACALRNLKKIMGQIASNNNNHSNNHSEQQQQQQLHVRHSQMKKTSKVHQRYSSPPMRHFDAEDICGGYVIDGDREARQQQKQQHHRQHVILEELEKNDENFCGGGGGGDSGGKYSNARAAAAAAVRPVTVIDMNMYNLDKSSHHAIKEKKCKTDPNTVLLFNGSTGDNNSAQQLQLSSSSSSTAVPTHKKNGNSVRDSFSAEGYHKTDHCYYKRPDGGYLKLPRDSYHKTAEGCYVKRADGTFVPIGNEKNVQQKTGCSSHQASESAAAMVTTVSGSTGTTGSITATTGAATRTKSNVLRFLKRSKSHTPTTMKELQKEKEHNDKVAAKVLRAANHSSGAGGQAPPLGSQNRRVMVTMIDGGLPVLATSKTERVSKLKPHNMSHNTSNSSSKRQSTTSSAGPKGKQPTKEGRNKVSTTKHYYNMDVIEKVNIEIGATV